MIIWCKWNEWGFRRALCTYRLNRAAGRTPWGGWDEWDDTALQTQYSKFAPWQSEVEYATSRLRRLPTVLNLYEWAKKKHFVSLKFEDHGCVRTRDSKQPDCTMAFAPPSDSQHHLMWVGQPSGLNLSSCRPVGQPLSLWRAANPLSEGALITRLECGLIIRVPLRRGAW